MEKSISEKEDQGDYINVENLDNGDINVVTPGTECGQEDVERSNIEKSSYSNINAGFHKNVYICG
jgi:hypothetical protein